MTRLRSAMSILGRSVNSRQTGAQAAEEFRWEEIMVQITFAFVIILGYLLSSKMETARDLGSKVREQEEKWRQQEARGNTLDKLVQELRKTNLGEALAARVTAEKLLQLETLLRVWADTRVDRPLYRLLRRLENAEAIPLDEINCLPVGEAFHELNRESVRVFLAAQEGVSPEEIVTLMESVLQRAGFNTTAKIPFADSSLLSSAAAELQFDKSRVSRDNLKMLRLRIVADLEGERKELFGLQCALVGRIASARRDKLAAIPLSKEETPSPEKSDPGLHMFATILTDLKAEMKLLPETVASIGQTAGRKPESSR